MSLKDIIEEHGGMIFGVMAVGIVLTGAIRQLSPGGLLYQLISRVMDACAGGA